ncbi:hypothetical protein [Roseiflexus castenholzii]|uniref:hypothetical protein n=1 Tax=Roseiflexus castenholzii TaxID=120962 RepID=UPI003C7AB3A9
MTNQPVIPQKHVSDHLFLLVGANPLPNLVAAKLLLKPGGKLYLVHSLATQPVAERLARYWIEVEKQSRPQYVCVDEADGTDIRQKIDNALQNIQSDHVGLNYTGGTKTMSVHACRTLLDYQSSQCCNVTLSYLDARSNKMYIEHGSNPLFKSDSVLYEVHPSLQDIVKLHAFNLVSPIETQAMLPDLANVLADAHESPRAGDSWRTWCDDVLRKHTRTKKPNEWDKEILLENISLPLPDDKSLRQVIDKMCEIFELSEQKNTLPLGSASQKVKFQKVKHLCEWFDGKWLEHYVFECISQIKNDCNVHDVGMGIRPQSDKDRPEYDVDIGVMRGYRLYAISCTTDADSGMCKLKLFEAYLRARNMAGDEAYVALVCMADNPEKIELHIGRSWDAAGKVRVFRRSYLGNLSTHLKDWLNSVVSS